MSDLADKICAMVNRLERESVQAALLSREAIDDAANDAIGAWDKILHRCLKHANDCNIMLKHTAQADPAKKQTGCDCPLSDMGRALVALAKAIK